MNDVYVPYFNSSLGNLAMFTAIRRASSRVSKLAADRRGKVVNPRAGSRWLFAFAALSELPLEPGKWSSLRYVVA